MARPDKFIGQLEGYLDEFEGMTPLPDSARATVRDALRTTRQIIALPRPMRYLIRSTSAPALARFWLVAAALLAAAVIAAAVAAASFLGR